MKCLLTVFNNKFYVNLHTHTRIENFDRTVFLVWSKVLSEALDFDPEDSTHLDFIEAATVLFAETYRMKRTCTCT